MIWLCVTSGHLKNYPYPNLGVCPPQNGAPLQKRNHTYWRVCTFCACVCIYVVESGVYVVHCESDIVDYIFALWDVYVCVNVHVYFICMRYSSVFLLPHTYAPFHVQDSTCFMLFLLCRTCYVCSILHVIHYILYSACCVYVCISHVGLYCMEHELSTLCIVHCNLISRAR